MDIEGNDSSGPVVRRLARLPLVDRVKLVKDLMLRELGGIHSHVMAVHGVADTMLANDWRVLRELESLCADVAAVRATGVALLADDSQLRSELDTLNSRIVAVHRTADEVLANDFRLMRELDAIHAQIADVRTAGDAMLAEGSSLRREMAAIHAEVAAVHTTADALLANDSPLLQASVSLIEAVQQARLEVDRQGQLLLNSLGHARQERHRQIETLLAAVGSAHEESTRHGSSLLEKVEEEVRELAKALAGLRGQTTQQGSLFLEMLRDDRHKGESRHQGLLDTLNGIEQETRRQGQTLLETLRSGHEGTREQIGQLVDALKQTNDTITGGGSAIVVALGEAQKGALDQGRLLEAALKELQVGFAEQSQILRDAVGRLRLEPNETLQGKAILLSNGESVGEPEADLMAHLYSYLPSRTAVDIGANVGDVSNRLLEAGYEVYAFEPHPAVFYHLNDRLGRQTDFHCFPWALGSIDETRQLHTASDLSQYGVYRDPALFSSLTLHSMPDDLVFSGSVTVSVRSLESLQASRHIPVGVGLVKIDTEGFDLQVIRGMGPHRYPVVVAEYWDPAIPFGMSGAMNKLDDMVKEMKGRGYHWYVVFYRIWGKEGVSFYCNHPRSVDHTYGNVFFFQDHAVFAQALLWCSAVLPATYVGR